ncbi:MAG: TIM barrel protein, partial [Eubacterium sp.]|nr:TIM barrel protein [Eubacterium sp.]
GSLDPAISGRGMELSIDSIHFAADIGLQIVQLMAYDEYFGEINEDTYSLFIENLGILSEEAASCGVMLAMENCDTVTMDNLEKGIRIVEAVNSPWLKIYPDIANLYATGMGNEEACRQYRLAADHIVATHVKDTVVGVVRDIAFGAGEVDFPLFFKTLGEMNFHGPMTLEFWDQNDGRAYETAAESLKFIKQHYTNSYKPVS